MPLKYRNYLKYKKKCKLYTVYLKSLTIKSRFVLENCVL